MVKTFLTVIISVVIIISSSGCTRRLARLERRQLKLHQQVKYNLRKLADNKSAIQNNEQNLKNEIENNANLIAQYRALAKQNTQTLEQKLKTGNQEIARDLHELKNGRSKLQQQTAALDRQLGTNAEAIENNQLQLQKKLRQDSQQLSENILAVENNLLALQKLIKTNQYENQKTAAKLTGLEKNQDQLFEKIENSELVLTERIQGLDNNILEVHKMTENNQKTNQEFTTKINAVEKNQIKFQDKIESDLRNLVKKIAENALRKKTRIIPQNETKSKSHPVKYEQAEITKK
jgi:chromosome segregation ATPase